MPVCLRCWQSFVGLCKQFPAQIVALAAQVSWSSSVLLALKGGRNSPGGLRACLDGLAWRLLAMSESVLGESPPALRKKYEQLITELVRERDATRRLEVRENSLIRALIHGLLVLRVEPVDACIGNALRSPL